MCSLVRSNPVSSRHFKIVVGRCSSIVYPCSEGIPDWVSSGIWYSSFLTCMAVVFPQNLLYLVGQLQVPAKVLRPPQVFPQRNEVLQDLLLRAWEEVYLNASFCVLKPFMGSEVLYHISNFNYTNCYVFLFALTFFIKRTLHHILKCNLWPHSATVFTESYFLLFYLLKKCTLLNSRCSLSFVDYIILNFTLCFLNQ